MCVKGLILSAAFKSNILSLVFSFCGSIPADVSYQGALSLWFTLSSGNLSYNLIPQYRCCKKQLIEKVWGFLRKQTWWSFLVSYMCAMYKQQLFYKETSTQIFCGVYIEN